MLRNTHVGGESIEDLPTITGVACVAYEKALKAEAGCIVVDDDTIMSKECGMKIPLSCKKKIKLLLPVVLFI